MLIRPSEQVRAVRPLSDLPSSAGPNGVRAHLGGFYAGERRKLLLVFEIPAIPALGLAEVATLEFTWVELPALKEHTVTVPVHVNVGAGGRGGGSRPRSGGAHGGRLLADAAGQAAGVRSSVEGRHQVRAPRDR